MSAEQNPGTGKTGGTIIHIGAGQCRELPEYLAGNPARILLVEPTPQRVRDLARRTAEHEHVEVRAVAVTDDPSRTRLQLFNLADLSSLRAPTGAYELFPGLKATGEVEVETVAPTDLLVGEALAAGQGNRLIIDAPGEEPAIVGALESTGTLETFDRIDLHCGREPLFEGGDSSEELLRRLAAAGHEIDDRTDAADPDRPCWRLSRSPLKVENRQLKGQLNERDSQLRELRERISSLEERTAECDKQARLAQRRKNEVDTLKKERAAAEEKADERQARIATLEFELAELKRRQGATQEEMSRAEGQIELIKDLVLGEPGK